MEESIIKQQDREAHQEICKDNNNVAIAAVFKLLFSDEDALSLYLASFQSPHHDEKYAMQITFDSFCRFVSELSRQEVFSTLQKDKGLDSLLRCIKPNGQWDGKKERKFDKSQLLPPEYGNVSVPLVKIVNIKDMKLLISLGRYTKDSKALTANWVNFMQKLFAVPGLQVANVQTSQQTVNLKAIWSVLKANALNNPALSKHSETLKANEYALVLDTDVRRVMVDQVSTLWVVLKSGPLQVQCNRQHDELRYEIKLPNGKLIDAHDIKGLTASLEKIGFTAAEKPMTGAKFLNEIQPNLNAKDNPIELANTNNSSGSWWSTFTKPIRKNAVTSLWSGSANSTGSNQQGAENNNNKVEEKSVAKKITFGLADKQNITKMLRSKQYTMADLSKLIVPLRYEFNSQDQRETFKSEFVVKMLVAMTSPAKLTKADVKTMADELHTQVCNANFNFP